MVVKFKFWFDTFKHVHGACLYSLIICVSPKNPLDKTSWLGSTFTKYFQSVWLNTDRIYESSFYKSVECINCGYTLYCKCS